MSLSFCSSQNSLPWQRKVVCCVRLRLPASMALTITTRAGRVGHCGHFFSLFSLITHPPVHLSSTMTNSSPVSAVSSAFPSPSPFHFHHESHEQAPIRAFVKVFSIPELWDHILSLVRLGKD